MTVLIKQLQLISEASQPIKNNTGRYINSAVFGPIKGNKYINLAASRQWSHDITEQLNICQIDTYIEGVVEI